MESTETTALKCVFVGDSAVGKTTLLHTLACGKIPDYDIPYYKVQNHTAEFTHQGRSYNLGLVDTSHDETHDRTRPLSYPDTDVFVVCFSPVRHTSLLNAAHRWAKEVAHYCPDKPIILLALRTDQRTDPKMIELYDRARQGSIDTPADGAKIAAEIGAERYLECSAVMEQGLQELLISLVEVGLSGKQNKSKTDKKGSKQKAKQECNITQRQQ